jgi:hypothetical protein
MGGAFGLADWACSGQWIRGGMTMVGDMFTDGLKATMSGLCSEHSIAAQCQTSHRYTAHALPMILKPNIEMFITVRFGAY